MTTPLAHVYTDDAELGTDFARTLAEHGYEVSTSATPAPDIVVTGLSDFPYKNPAYEHVRLIVYTGDEPYEKHVSLQAALLGIVILEAKQVRKLILEPHLLSARGWSAINHVRDFWEFGLTPDALILPSIKTFNKGSQSLVRLALIHLNKPGVIGHVTTLLGERGYNIDRIMNDNSMAVGYTLIDINEEPVQEMLDKIRRTEDMICVRLIHLSA